MRKEVKFFLKNNILCNEEKQKQSVNNLKWKLLKKTTCNQFLGRRKHCFKTEEKNPKFL